MGNTTIKIKILNSIRKLFRFPLAEKLLYIFSKNHTIESFIGKIIPGNNLYRSKTMRTVTRKNINYRLDISDYQNWLIYFGIKTDEPKDLLKLIQPGNTVIDIGSNIGQTSMNIAKICGNNGLVFGFEPDPVNFNRAIENLNLNSFTNIKYYNVGLGDKKGVLHLKINTPSNRGGNRIDKNGDNNSHIKVPIETLDTFTMNENLQKVDLIKIDVEGFETEVLKGAEKMIAKFKPMLYIELDDNNLKAQGTDARALINYIQTMGYEIKSSKEYSIITPETDLNGCHLDVVCKYI
jgi:FkbM family methyltransferase